MLFVIVQLRYMPRNAYKAEGRLVECGRCTWRGEGPLPGFVACNLSRANVCLFRSPS